MGDAELGRGPLLALATAMTKFALPLVLALAACDSGTAAFDEAAAPVEGIYQVTSYTRNDAACAPGTTSLLRDDKFAVAFMQDVFGTPVLNVMSCASVADCRAKVEARRAEEQILIEWHFAVNEVGANDALIGRGGDSPGKSKLAPRALAAAGGFASATGADV